MNQLLVGATKGEIMVRKILASVIIGGILSINAFAVKYNVQDPKGSTMALVPFEHKLFNFQFNVKYPESWYASEEYATYPSLYLTKEPVRSVSDKYTLGASFTYLLNFFMTEEPKNTPLGKSAKSVLSVRKWDTTKKEMAKNYKDQGMSILSQEDLDVSGWPAMRLDCSSSAVRLRVYFIKAGTHLLTITFEAPPQEFDKYDKLFQEMMASFVFSKEFSPADEGKVFEEKVQKVIQDQNKSK